MPSDRTSHHPPALSNPLKTRLQMGQPVVGITITTNNVEVGAELATLGFDFLWLEMEHAPLSLETVRNIVLATRGLPAVPVARPPVTEVWTAKQLLDMGVLGVIFPFTSTPELAARAARACRYPPHGVRGSGASLAQFRWNDAKNYYDFSDENVIVIAIIEDVQGLTHIDEIASTPGIDVLFIGTSDLSFSLGLRGRQNDRKLDAAIDKILETGKKHRKILGCPVRSPGQLKQLLRKGFLFFQAPTDLDFMAAGAQQFLAPLGRKCKVQPPMAV